MAKSSGPLQVLRSATASGLTARRPCSGPYASMALFKSCAVFTKSSPALSNDSIFGMRTVVGRAERVSVT
jgi:hypothetical protein